MTTELKPGTPEYDEAYKKEMERLEAEATTKTTSKADDKTDKTVEKKADDGKTESADEIKARLDKAERELQTAQKAIKDTQRWGHENAKEVKRLKAEADERKRRESYADDPVLKANPGLEETIKRVAKPIETEKPRETWLETVARAIPDVESLLADQSFYAKAAEKKTDLGDDWNDPISAIRELSALRTEHLTQKNVTAAVEAARKDFESKSKKRSAMEVPGGSGGKSGDAPQGDEAVKRFQTMSKADFDKERSRVMGY